MTGRVSTSVSAYTWGSGVGGAAGPELVRAGMGVRGATGTSCASTCAVFPAPTVTLRDQGSNPSCATSTRCAPDLSLWPTRGVWPTEAPSMRTAAPAGVERTSAAPTDGGTRVSDTLTAELGAAAVRVTVCVTGV